MPVHRAPLRSRPASTTRGRLLPAIIALLLVLVGSAVLPTPHATAAPTGPRYREPVAGGLIIDHFRPPPTPYASGNRGVDEFVAPDTPVVASAAGVVVFAGAVADALHVTVLHADGLRTTYSFLTAIAVVEGQRVRQGQLIGTAGGLVHFGVRDGQGHYLDPEALWAGALGAHLVPGSDELEHAAGAEAPLLAAETGSGTRAGSARRRARAIEAAAAATAFDPAGLGRDLAAWGRSQQGCTPAATPAPATPVRRVAVLVGGLGSSSRAASIDALDLAALGYQPGDVVRFSYRGGRVPSGPVDSGPLAAIASSAYDAADTTADLRAAGRRLRSLVDAVHRAAPGVPVDLIAHSMGGVVARLAIGQPPEPPLDVATVITLGTPHQGAPLATAAAGSGATGGALVDLLSEHTDLPGPSVAVAQLSQGSDVVAQLARPLRPGTRLVTLAASGDLVVPVAATEVDGGTQVLVHLQGIDAHSRLPGDPVVTREIALARAGKAPTCQAWAQAAADLVLARAIARAEASIGLELTAG